jgi:hypothetical protein
MTTTPERFDDFFAASAGVAGALIGLLFVAISVASNRLTGPDGAQAHRVRASSALTAFTNALTVSLFALIPGIRLGRPVVAVAIVGLLFVAGSLASLLRVRATQPEALRDATFLVGLVVVFVLQLDLGIRAGDHPERGPVSSIAVLVIVCFLIGISRSWELIGGPSISLRRELTEKLKVTVAHGDPPAAAGIPSGAADDPKAPTP